jgi:hypothetical protein
VAAIPTVPNQGEYLVVWEFPHSPGNGDIYGGRLDGEANPVGGMLWIAPKGGHAHSPTVAGSEGAGEYMVAWNQVIEPPNTYSGARARTVNMIGEFTSEETWLWWFYSDYPAATSGPLGDFLVTFHSLGVDYGIYGQLWGNRAYLPIVVRGFH